MSLEDLPEKEEKKPHPFNELSDRMGKIPKDNIAAGIGVIQKFEEDLKNAKLTALNRAKMDNLAEKPLDTNALADEIRKAMRDEKNTNKTKDDEHQL